MRIRRCAVLAAALAVAFGVATEKANAAFSVHIASNTLTVTGDAASDTLALRLTPGDPQTLILDVGNNGSADFTANRLLFNRIVVNAGAGNDTMLIDESKGAFTDQEATTLNGQDGNDTLTGGRGPETLIGADGNDRVTGGRGNDTALLGIGDDTFVWNATDDSDVVEGQAGTDTLDFHGSSANENIDLSASSRLRLTRDVGSVVMDAAAVEHVSVHVGGGRDTLTVNSLAGTDVTRVDADLGGSDSAADTVTVNGTASADTIALSAAGGVVQANTGPASVFVSHTEPANDVLQVNTLAGLDSVSFFRGVSPLLSLNIDGGADADTILPTGTAGPDSVQLVLSATPSTVDVSMDGGSTFAHILASDVSDKIDAQTLGGADTILAGNGLSTLTPLVLDGGPGPDTITGGDGNDFLFGGDDNDTITGGRGTDTAFLGNGDDTFVWNPGDSSDVVEGQAGADTLDFHGSNASEKIDLSANGNRLRLTRDVAAILMDTNAVEHVTVHLLGGTDQLTVNPLAGTDVTRVDADLGGADAAADTVIVNGTAGADTVSVSASGGVVQANTGPASVFVSDAEPANDVLQVNTLAGSDSVSFFRGVSPLLSLNVDGGADSDTIFPTGTSGTDSVQLVLSVTPSTVDVSMDGGSTFAHVLASDVSDRINVQTLGGADTIQAGNGLSTLTPLVLDGGTGPDTITGGDGNDTLLGGDDNDTVTGGRGTDVAFLGNGNDTFVWNPGDNSDVVEGQANADTLAMDLSNASEKVELAANGGRLRLTRDIASITMDTDDVETVDLHALGGTDTITVDSLLGTDVTRVNADLAGTLGGSAGDGAADTVVVNGTDLADTVPVTASGGVVKAVNGPTSVFVPNAEPANDVLQVNTLAGNDLVSFFPGVTAALILSVDGGLDTDTVFPTGTAGPDMVVISAPTPPAVDVALPTGVAHLLAETVDVQTLAGADTITGLNGVAGTGARIVLDGGPDADAIAGTDAPDLIIGGDGADQVDGNRGDDTALLGTGDDNFIWNPGDGNDVVEGQANTDTLTMDLSNIGEKVELSANGGRLRLTRDVANITMDTDDVETVDLHALGGTDTITVDPLLGTDVTRVNAGLGGTLAGGSGDGAADLVRVVGTTGADTAGIAPSGSEVQVQGLGPKVFIADSEPANDTLEVDGLDGNDTLTGTAGLAGLTKLTLDGGLAADTLTGGDGGDTLIGGDGADIIRGMAGDDFLFGGPGTDTLNGGAGADTFSCGGPGDTLVTDAFDTIGPDC